jgi:hypothetical protein
MVALVGMVWGLAAVEWTSFIKEHYFPCQKGDHVATVQEYTGDRNGKFHYITTSGEKIEGRQWIGPGERTCVWERPQERD